MDRCPHAEMGILGTVGGALNVREESRRAGSPRDELLAWSGVVPRFSRLREGGPGRPATLLVAAALLAALVWQGYRLTDRDGIGGFGPALSLVSVLLLLGLGVWLVIKALLRSREVRFVLSEDGISIRPSQRQVRLDRNMRILAHLSFLVAWSGGQWTAWRPFVRWRDVRAVRYLDAERQILVTGGAWDIRLQCPADIHLQAVGIIRSRTGAQGSS